MDALASNVPKRRTTERGIEPFVEMALGRFASTAPAYAIGRRTGMCDPAGSEAWSFDSMGRNLTEQRTTNGRTKSTSYTYNPDGSMATLTYPSGRIITYAPNAASQPVSAVDGTNGINYVTAAAYAPQGALSSLTLGYTGASPASNSTTRTTRVCSPMN